MDTTRDAKRRPPRSCPAVACELDQLRMPTEAPNPVNRARPSGVPACPGIMACWCGACAIHGLDAHNARIPGCIEPTARLNQRTHGRAWQGFQPATPPPPPPPPDARLHVKQSSPPRRMLVHKMPTPQLATTNDDRGTHMAHRVGTARRSLKQLSRIAEASAIRCRVNVLIPGAHTLRYSKQ